LYPIGVGVVGVHKLYSKTPVKTCTPTIMYPKWCESGVFCGGGTKSESPLSEISQIEAFYVQI